MKSEFKRSLILIVSAIMFIVVSTGYSAEDITNTTSEANNAIPEVPVKNTVTMVDLGAKKCIPCKMMAPILENLKKIYSGKAAIVFIDVWENREAGEKFGIKAIPTQIFFDAQGKEVSRHTGFLSEEEIKAQISKMGVSI
ncbi:MAG: thioredoxin family protein [Desulfamplus sp.]